MIGIAIGSIIKGIGALFLILVMISIYIVLNNAKEKAVAEKIHIYIENKQNLWYRYLNDEIPLPQELIPNNNIEIKAIEVIFLAYVENVSNPSIKEKIRKYSNKYLRQYYLGLLSSKRWSLRMNALYRIISFGKDSLADECKKLEKRAKLSPEERFQLLVIQSAFDEANFVKEFANLSIKLSEYEYKKLLIGFNSDILKKMTHHMKDFPEEYQYYFIDVLGISRSLDFLPFLENNLSHKNPEIRIRSLKAINEIGIVSDMEPYKVFLNSPIWEERLMLAKLLGVFSLEEAYPYLEQLLQDENWWVRSNAARSIGNSKDGRSRLEMFIATAHDQYAIDMAREVLGEGTG